MQMEKNWFIVIVVIGIVLVGAVALYIQSLHPPPPVSLQEISFCPTPGLPATLVWIAKDQGYFAKHGLNVSLRSYPTGIAALQDLLTGKLDFAMASEYTVAQQMLTTDSSRVIGSIDQTETMSVVARRDKGIDRISDLEGKKIGISRQSIAEYLLARFFVLNGLSIDKVTVVDLQPPQIAAALERGDIDAAIVQQPYPYQIQQKMEKNIVVWPANLGQPSYYLITCTETTLKEKPKVIENLLASLLEAETFVNSPNQVRGEY